MQASDSVYRYICVGFTDFIFKGKIARFSRFAKALADTDITHEEFALFTHEAENCHRLKENIRMKKSQSSDIEYVN